MPRYLKLLPAIVDPGVKFDVVLSYIKAYVPTAPTEAPAVAANTVVVSTLTVTAPVLPFTLVTPPLAAVVAFATAVEPI
jgi:hypothetical protein